MLLIIAKVLLDLLQVFRLMIIVVEIIFDAHENIKATRAVERKLLLCLAEGIGLLSRTC